jgi:hypothetical protein
MEGRKEGRKEGKEGMKGRKEGREEGREEERATWGCCTSFKMAISYDILVQLRTSSVIQ